MDAALLGSVSNANIDAISKCLAAMEVLKADLMVYKDVLVNSINLEAESADISSAYGQPPASPQYNLPGVYTNMPTPWDIDQIRADSQRMIDIQGQRNKVAAQSDLYLNKCKREMAVLIENWKNLSFNNLAWKDYLLTLNKGLNPAY